MRHKLQLLVIPVLLGLFAQGCGTVATHQEGFGKFASKEGNVDAPTTGVYRGVRLDWGNFSLQAPFEGTGNGGAIFPEAMIFCDLPLSAVGDTVTLPFDAWRNPSHREQSADSNKSPQGERQ